MNRAVTFRGKRDNGKWVKGFYAKLGGYHFIFSGRFLHRYGTPERWEVAPATVGQFSDEVDKKANKICEGDRLAMFVNDARLPGYEEVQFMYGSFWLRHRHMPLYEWLLRDGHDAEIIGNIHDNPELLTT